MRLFHCAASRGRDCSNFLPPSISGIEALSIGGLATLHYGASEIAVISVLTREGDYVRVLFVFSARGETLFS